MEFPDLTIGICTFKRPWYAVHCIHGFRDRLLYSGKKKFIISDGGSPDEDIGYYLQILKGCDVQVCKSDNLSTMINNIALNSGELFIVSVDDYFLMEPLDITADVMLMLHDPEIGQVRYSRMAYWGSGGRGPETYAKLVDCPKTGFHWLKLDKQRTTDSYMCSVGVHLYHRRFWDAYGDIPACQPDVPGEAELLGSERFRKIDGPTVAVPLRLGQDCSERKEFFWHAGVWRTDNYARTAGNRW
jgi:hypothetical protein